MRDSTMLLVLVALAAFGSGGGGSRKPDDIPVDPDPDDDDDQGDDVKPPPPKPTPDCVTGEAYVYAGPELRVVPAELGMTPAEYSAAATVLTRVINEAYEPMPPSACSRRRVSTLAGLYQNETQALAMLTYWRLYGAGLRHPQVDDQLTDITRPERLEVMKRLRIFFAKAADQKQA